MKKSLAITLGLLAGTALANQPNTSQAEAQPPSLTLEVFDTSTGVHSIVEGRKFSVSRKNIELCWTAFNLSIEPNNTSIEIFVSPKRATFVDQGSKISKSKDGRKHTITSTFSTDKTDQDLVRKCWKFDKKDPLGKYTLEVQVNNIKFPPQTFHVVK
ncbi:MAG: hypothetical protein Q4A60_03325 [Pasteurellaceae bacterium]|nr:hypothetical protein [Pasteurellaceae bacterium]